MELIYTKINKREIIHFAESGVFISSQNRTIYYQRDTLHRKVVIPEPNLLFFLAGFFRISRRFLRLDKVNVFLHKLDLIIIRKGKVYYYNYHEEKLIHTLTLRNCRTLLYNSITSSPEGYIYFGEYGSNKKRKPVTIYCSKNGGSSWNELYTFPAGSIRHIHGCYYDIYTDNIWVCTGDFENENWLFRADKTFRNISRFGDGQQKFRTCNLIFLKNEIHWLMDSHLEQCYHVIMNRKTNNITLNQKLQGPVIYLKELDGGYYLATTSQEIGKGVLDDKTYLYISFDLKNWKIAAKFDHDGLPKRLFRFGLIGFAAGKQTIDCFYMFIESLKKLDGKSFQCSIKL